MEIEKILIELAQKRPIFHSEADFQHALAWHIQTSFPMASVRLEYQPNGFKKTFIDIWIETDTGEKIAIELKYKTSKTSPIMLKNEIFELENQGAFPKNRALFLKDVARLQELMQSKKADASFAILLTNCSEYWETPENLYRSGKKVTDFDFRIHEGIILKGHLQWQVGTAKSTIRDTLEFVDLKETYNISWESYRVHENTENGVMKYLLLKIS